MKLLKRLLPSLLTFWILGQAQAQETATGQVVDKIVAKVDNNILLESEVQKSYLEAVSQAQQGIEAPTRCSIFESLLINKLMVAKAVVDSVIVTDAEVLLEANNRFAMVMQQFGGDEAMLAEMYGKTADQLKAELEEVMREQLIVRKMRKTITDGITVSPAEVRAFFGNIPADSLPLFTSEATVGQIVRKPETSPKVREDIIAQLLQFKEAISSGKSTFAELAKAYSEDPGSGAQGGDLGFFRRGELAPEYEATALGLRQGEISDPVETQFGFHMIQLLEIKGSTFNTRHILRIPKASEEDIVKAERYLDSLKKEILADKIDFAKAAKEYSQDRTTSDAGGFFTDPATTSNRLSLRTLEDPVLYFTIDTMKIGDITPPIRFEDPREGTKVRILFYKARYPAHKANLEDDYEKLKAATLRRKEDEVLSKWFVTAKEDIFIDIDPSYDRCDALKDK
jgi:peptidyl-prolyl cis-trans isomerase SurA